MPYSASNKKIIEHANPSTGAGKRQVYLLTFPKPFTGHIATIQLNAFANWSLLPDITVLVAGDDDGIAEACQMFNYVHIKNVPTSKFGTPYLNSVFDRVAKQSGAGDVIIYANADIIFQPNLLALITRLKYSDYLVGARRYNIDVHELLPASVDCFRELQKKAINTSHLSQPFSSDIFILPAKSQIVTKMPQLMVGRKGWDNWMLWAARDSGIPLIDATAYLGIVHQNHSYQHIVKSTQEDIRLGWLGQESDDQACIIKNHALSLDFAAAHCALSSIYKGTTLPRPFCDCR